MINSHILAAPGAFVGVPRGGFDVCFFALGYESRCTHLMALKEASRVAVALPFVTNADAQFEENRRLFASAGVSIADLHDESDFASAFTSTLARAFHGRRNRSLAIDISSLTRSRLAACVSVLHKLAAGSKSPVHARFYYSPAAFEAPPSQAPSVLVAEAVAPRFKGRLRRSSIPLGAVIGLGYEPQRALGAFELLEPARAWAFKPISQDVRYSDALNLANEQLIDSVGRNRVFPYPVGDPASTFSAVESFVFSMMDEYRLVLIPMGPKIFALVCLLVALVDSANAPAVWRVGERAYQSPLDAVSDGSLVYLDTQFDAKGVSVFPGGSSDLV